MDVGLYRFSGADGVCTPAFVVYEDIVRENTRICIREAGGADRLWPHVKSHKMAEMVRMQMDMGIRRFKCATLPEARMAAGCGAAHVLVAYPLIGPNVSLFLDLIGMFPGTRFYAIGDDVASVARLSEAACARSLCVELLADVNLGMDRTGTPLAELRAFIDACEEMPGIHFRGLHLYDGHIHDRSFAEREAKSSAPMRDIFRLRDACPHGADWILIAGGSPTMPCHALEDVYLSPGTVFFWDAGYAASFPDMPYTPAAAVMTRVVSHPAPGLFTLDCGSKAIACDPAGARGTLVGIDNARVIMQNEEHWVFGMPEGEEEARPAIGDTLFVIPTHVCPTTALYAKAVVVSDGAVRGTWNVAARDRDCLAADCPTVR